MMKKFIAVLLCLMTVFSLASCMNQEAPDGEQPNTEQGSGDNTSSGNSSTGGSPSSSKPSKKALAKQAYEAVFNNDVTLRRVSTEKDVYLQDMLPDIFYYREPGYVFIDMDGDGIDEVVIAEINQYSGDKLILNYYDGVVYGYEFDYNGMQAIYSDGSFTWQYYNYHDYNKSIDERGCSRISFDGAKMKFTELYRFEYYQDAYYIDGAKVSEEKYNEYIEKAYQTRTLLEYTQFDTSMWNKDRAIALASEYWGVTDGSFDEETGYRYRVFAYKAYGANACYYVCLHQFVKNQYDEHVKCVWLNVDTGEISDHGYCNMGKG